MIFTIGDTVKVAAKEKLPSDKARHAGEILTVTRRYFDGRQYYEVKENSLKWYDEELELDVSIDDIKSFKVGDAVLITANGATSYTKDKFIGRVFEVASANQKDIFGRTVYTLMPNVGCIWRAGEMEKLGYNMDEAEELI